MPDAIISALPSSAGFADTDLLPIVQGGVTKKALGGQLAAMVLGTLGPSSSITPVAGLSTIPQLFSSYLAANGPLNSQGQALANRIEWLRSLSVQVSDSQFAGGAAQDGSRDDTPAFQAAIDAVSAAGGGTVLFNGRCLIDTNLVIKDGVRLLGPLGRPGELLPGSSASYNSKRGVLLINPAITVTAQDSASVEGCVAVRKGLSLPFADAAAAAAGVAAFSGTAFTVGGADAVFSRLLILGFNRAIDSANFERTVCDAVYGDCINGIRLVTVSDIARVENCHFWPWTTTHQTWTTDALLLRTGTAYEFSSVGDWSKLTNCFCYGYLTGYVIDSCDNVNVVSCGADYAGALASTSVGFTIKGTSKDTLLLGCQAAAQGTGILINTSATTGAVATISGGNLWANDLQHIRVQQGRAIVTGGTRMRAGAIGVQADNTSQGAMIAGNEFDTVPTPFSLAAGAALEKSIIGQNQFSNTTDSTTGQRTVFDNQVPNTFTSAYGSSGAGHQMVARYARGTADSPLIAIANDQPLRIRGQVWDGAAWGTVGMIRIQMNGTPAAGSLPGQLIFSTTKAGAAAETDWMSLDNAGNLAPLGATQTQDFGSVSKNWRNIYAANVVLQLPAVVTPVNNGDMSFQLTSNTQLTVKVKGSDGTVRSSSLTLA